MNTTFSISFPDQPLEYLADDPTVPSAIGILVLGDFQEEFASVLSEWSTSDYERQWQEAIVALLSGREKVGLMTEYVGPNASHHVWWPLYRLGSEAAAQNHIAWHDPFAEPFAIERQFDFVRDRRTMNEDGQSISEWSVPLESIRKFAIASGWWPTASPTS
jgi:hypothetical protein